MKLLRPKSSLGKRQPKCSNRMSSRLTQFTEHLILIGDLKQLNQKYKRKSFLAIKEFDCVVDGAACTYRSSVPHTGYTASHAPTHLRFHKIVLSHAVWPWRSSRANSDHPRRSNVPLCKACAVATLLGSACHTSTWEPQWQSPSARLADWQNYCEAQLSVSIALTRPTQTRSRPVAVFRAYSQRMKWLDKTICRCDTSTSPLSMITKEGKRCDYSVLDDRRERIRTRVPED